MQWSQDTRIFVDTSSLMEKEAEAAFHTRLIPIVRQHGIRPIIVARSVAEELNRLVNRSDELVARQARAATVMVKNLVNTGDAELIGSNDDDPHADNQFQAMFTKFRCQYPLVIIAQDRGLVRDLLSLNVSNAVKGIQEIRAIRINRIGDIMGWALDPTEPDGLKWHPLHSNSPTGRDDSRETVLRKVDSGQYTAPFSPFPTYHRHVLLDETTINTTSHTREGDIVKDKEGKSIQLLTKVGAGGEGTVYETSQDGLVCKIYHSDRLKTYIIDKLDLMVTRQISHSAICWPFSQAYNPHGEMVGYLMPRAEGRALQPTFFIPPLLRRNCPDWTRIHLVNLSAAILDAVAYLHSLNVLLGDINPRNILVQDDSTIFLVDCDSYQVEGYPCPVGMPPYLSPELYKERLSSILRTERDEAFAVATLVFMLLHPGKPPYSHEGGADPSRNVLRRHFPYPRGGKGAQGVPPGAWRFMFSHLPRYMKDTFHEVFTDGRYLHVGEWQELMSRYSSDLRNGYVSEDPFPKEFKRPSRQQIEAGIGFSRRCTVCGEEFGTYDEGEVVCRRCS